MSFLINKWFDEDLTEATVTVTDDSETRVYFAEEWQPEDTLELFLDQIIEAAAAPADTLEARAFFDETWQPDEVFDAGLEHQVIEEAVADIAHLFDETWQLDDPFTELPDQIIEDVAAPADDSETRLLVEQAWQPDDEAEDIFFQLVEDAAAPADDSETRLLADESWQPDEAADDQASAQQVEDSLDFLAAPTVDDEAELAYSYDLVDQTTPDVVTFTDDGEERAFFAFEAEAEDIFDHHLVVVSEPEAPPAPPVSTMALLPTDFIRAYFNKPLNRRPWRAAKKGTKL